MSSNKLLTVRAATVLGSYCLTQAFGAACIQVKIIAAHAEASIWRGQH